MPAFDTDRSATDSTSPVADVTDVKLMAGVHGNESEEPPP
jgi:hypothetical protein